ncbi:MAG: hypothetical protein LLG97_19620 [Deltaproteobacteria bacterium]|nr:hypothetical protein [Deltaproteobacteria bacterium]
MERRRSREKGVMAVRAEREPIQFLVVDDPVHFPTMGDVVRLLAAGTTEGQASFDDIRSLIRGAIPEKCWIVELFPACVIVQEDEPAEKLWQYPYSIMDGKVTLGERIEVEKQYAKVQAASRLAAALGDPKDADYGYRWRVQIIEQGVDKQGIAEYPLNVLHAAAPLYDGARVFALTQGQHDDPDRPFGKSVRDLVGWISESTPNASGLEGTLNILKSAVWLRDMAVDAWERGKKDLIGLSHDVFAKTVASAAAQKGRAERIVKVDSVDVVYDPIGGGKFLRMAAAARGGRKEDETMLEKLLAALKKSRPDAYKTIEAKVADKTVTEDEVIALLGAGPGLPADLDTRITAAVTAAMSAGSGQNAEAAKLLDQMRIQACGITLRDELAGSDLPDLSQTRIREQFEGKVFETAQLQAAITKEKEYVDKLTGSGSVTGAGQVRIGAEEPEKLQAAMDKLLGVTVDDKFKDVPPLESLRAAYTRLTGDQDVRGIATDQAIRQGTAIMSMLRLPAAYSSASFSFVLGNSMYRRLVQEYRAVDYNEAALISYRRNARDFRTMESINVGYFGDLPDIDPESGDYQEITMATDEEISYAVNQKGIILTITRKVIINDDLKSVMVLVSRLGRAARRTFARRGWAKINGNATFKGDSKALFHNDHANLGAVALTNDAAGITTLANRLIAMFAQTEKDSGEALCLEPKILWVPRAVLETAKALNSPWPIAGTVNPHAGRFGANHERIMVNKLATDANNWGLIADPGDVELLEVAFLNGREEPELFVADNPLTGQMFTSDKIQYKQRHEYEWEIADYRGFDCSVVAG